jgi:hypothetical protein
MRYRNAVGDDFRPSLSYTNREIEYIIRTVHGAEVWPNAEMVRGEEPNHEHEVMRMADEGCPHHE